MAADARGAEVVGVDAFARAIADQKLIPASMSRPAAIAALSAEIAVGVWLLLHHRPRIAAGVGIALLAAFSIYLAVAYARNPKMPCGCMGRLSDSTVREALVRNALLIGALCVSFAGSWRRRGRETPSAHPATCDAG